MMFLRSEMITIKMRIIDIEYFDFDSAHRKAKYTFEPEFELNDIDGDKIIDTTSVFRDKETGNVVNSGRNVRCYLLGEVVWATLRISPSNKFRVYEIGKCDELYDCY